MLRTYGALNKKRQNTATKLKLLPELHRFIYAYF